MESVHLDPYSSYLSSDTRSSSRSRWSDTTVMKFVNLYKSEPVLWDPEHPLYKEKNERFNALSRLVQGMEMQNFGIHECRQKIKNLRSQYNQELLKIRKSELIAKTPDEVFKPTLVWFSTMHEFVKPFVTRLAKSAGDVQGRHREVTDPGQFEYVDVEWENSGDVEDDAENPPADEGDVFVSEDTEDQSHSENDRSGFDQTQLFPKSETFPEGSRSIRGKKRKLMYMPQNLPMSLEQNFDRSSGFQSGAPETEFDVWAKSVAMQLNDMEVTRALELQLKIQTLLVEERIAHERCKYE